MKLVINVCRSHRFDHPASKSIQLVNLQFIGHKEKQHREIIKTTTDKYTPKTHIRRTNCYSLSQSMSIFAESLINYKTIIKMFTQCVINSVIGFTEPNKVTSIGSGNLFL